MFGKMFVLLLKLGLQICSLIHQAILTNFCLKSDFQFLLISYCNAIGILCFFCLLLLLAFSMLTSFISSCPLLLLVFSKLIFFISIKCWKNLILSRLLFFFLLDRCQFWPEYLIL